MKIGTVHMKIQSGYAYVKYVVFLDNSYVWY